MSKNDKVQHLRNQPNLRCPNFEGDWVTKKISDILTIKSGKDQKVIENPNGKYPIFGTGGIIGYGDEYLTNKKCVCIGRKGTIDKPVYMTSPFWSVDTLFYSEYNVNNDPKFQYNLFETINWYKYNEASGVPSLSRKTIEGIKVFIPDYEEQKKIGASFSLIELKIELLEEKLKNLKLFKRGLFNKTIINKGTSRKLSEISTMYAGGTPSTIKKEYWNGNIPWLQSGKIQDCYINSDDVEKHITQIGLKKSSAKMISKDSVLIAITGATCGKIGYLNFDSTANQSVVSVTPLNEQLDAKYLYYYLQKNNNDIMRLQGGSAQGGVTLNDLRKLLVIIPNIEYQEKISNQLYILDLKISNLSKTLSTLKQFKKGLLQQMFV